MEVGAVIDGRYRLVEEAGRGGMGTVFRAVDAEDERPVAVKVLHPHQSHPENAVRFAREAATLASLTHPAVVRYRAHGSSDGVEWLVTEWLEGRDLAERLKDAPLTIAETMELGRRVARMLHRDIKPSNLFLVDDEVAQVRLLDFGVAHNRALASVTTVGSAVGTPAYMAPEQARAEGEVDGRADLFSLGCVLWECLAGRRAFEGSSALGVLAKVLLEEVPPIASLVDGVPEAIDRALVSMLDKAPEERPTAGLVGQLFAELRATLPLGDARRPAPRPSAKRLGVQPETISRWENGKRAIPPPADRALRLCVVKFEPIDDYGIELLEYGDAASSPSPVGLEFASKTWRACA